jgi:hypothetical protein
LEDTAPEFLDGGIKRQLIPLLQDDALKSTTSALEREDAYSPAMDHNLYGKISNEPQDAGCGFPFLPHQAENARLLHQGHPFWDKALQSAERQRFKTKHQNRTPLQPRTAFASSPVSKWH